MLASTSELVAGCLRGDDGAKASFYVEFSGLVRRAVARRLTAMGMDRQWRTETEDIANEVFERIFSNECRLLRRLHHPSRIHAWLVAVAANYTVDYLRRLETRGYGRLQSRTNPAAECVPNTDALSCSPDCALEHKEQKERLNRELEKLSGQERLILDLFYVQGMKYVQIAGMLALNVNTVSAKLRRAREKLRRALKERNHDLAC
ncbi:MAG TPA: sigma-70 family RNA polymerase sigma factor [Candidatus Hydrogenedentes bacterium]|nr:sigma-70 family RNA polymerase sigma factor [Candidatus Hydrogenedentota bacterium]